MITIKLNSDQLEALKTIVNRAQISGADAEFVSQLKYRLANPTLEEKDPDNDN